MCSTKKCVCFRLSYLLMFLGFSAHVDLFGINLDFFDLHNLLISGEFCRHISRSRKNADLIFIACAFIQQLSREQLDNVWPVQKCIAFDALLAISNSFRS